MLKIMAEAARSSTRFCAISVKDNSQPPFTCSKSTKETPEKSVKSVQS